MSYYYGTRASMFQTEHHYNIVTKNFFQHCHQSLIVILLSNSIPMLPYKRFSTLFCLLVSDTFRHLNHLLSYIHVLPEKTTYNK